MQNKDPYYNYKNDWIGSDSTKAIKSKLPYINAEQIKSSYLNSSNTYNKKPAGLTDKTLIFGIRIILYITFLQIAFMLFTVNKVSSGWFILGIFSLIFGMVFLYGGFRRFSTYLNLSSMPIAKTDAASAGLNKFSGNFVSEDNKKFIAPISGKECIYFSTYLQITSGGNNPNEHLLRTVSSSRGANLLLTDQNGYLAIDFANANIMLPTVLFQALASPGSNDNKNANAVADALGRYDGYNPKQIKDAINNVTNSAKLAVLGKDVFLWIREAYVPSEANFFAVGETRDTGKKLDGKAIKSLSVHPELKLLSITCESSSSLIDTYLIDSKLYLISGVLMSIIGVFFLLK